MNKQEFEQLLKIHTQTAKLFIPNFHWIIQFSKHQAFEKLRPNSEITFKIFADTIKHGGNEEYFFSDILDTWYKLFLYFVEVNHLSLSLQPRTNLSTEMTLKLQLLTDSFSEAKSETKKIKMWLNFKTKLTNVEQNLFITYPIYIKHMTYGEQTVYLKDILTNDKINIELVEILLWQIIIDQLPDTVIPDKIIVSAVDNQYWYSIKDKAITSTKVAKAYLNEGLRIQKNINPSLIPHPAKHMFSQAIHFNPKLKEAYQHRYLINREQCYIQLAIDDLIALKSFNPQNAEIYLLISKLYLFDNKLELALENITIAIKLDDKNADEYLQRGKIYQKLNKFNLAIADFTQAIEVNSTFAEAFNCRGELYSKQGELKPALLDFEAAIKYNPRYSDAKRNYNHVMVKLKNVEANTVSNSKNNFWQSDNDTSAYQKKRKEREEVFNDSSEEEQQHKKHRK